MDSFTNLAKQTLERCEQLAKITQTPNQVDRRYLSDEHHKANQCVAEWMRHAGMHTWVDQAGNQWGRYTSGNPVARTLVVGSHLDTVPNAGKYDGILGVVAAISVIQMLSDEKISLPFHVEVVGFGDEEGTRFGSTLLGSRAVAGTWQREWQDLQDEQGQSLSQCMADFGLDITQVSLAARTDIDAFIELHIEQGPVLEHDDLALGVVTDIAGAQRFEICLKGHAGHAGTVPMTMRQDPLVCASEMIVKIHETAKLHSNAVATVGRLQCLPGAVNVIPGKVIFSLDVRSPNDQVRSNLVDEIQNMMSNKARQYGLGIDVTQTHYASAVACDEELQKQLANAIQGVGLPTKFLYSGAGHDTMAMAECCPSAMLFMRCEKGISHHPDEAVTNSDVALALAAMHHFVMHYGD
jgi:allantoate deiminase